MVHSTLIVLACVGSAFAATKPLRHLISAPRIVSDVRVFSTYASESNANASRGNLFAHAAARKKHMERMELLGQLSAEADDYMAARRARDLELSNESLSSLAGLFSQRLTSSHYSSSNESLNQSNDSSGLAMNLMYTGSEAPTPNSKNVQLEQQWGQNAGGENGDADADRTGGMFEVVPPPMPPPELKDIYMRYMPDYNMVVCGCAKCGTSSVYNYIYEKEFGEPWPYKGEPYIHEVTSERWMNRFAVIPEFKEQRELMDSAYSFALVRDPKERLISAWKSKIACGGEYHTDFDTRQWMVSELRLLANMTGVTECMELEEFLETVSMVHAGNKAYLLDRHFLPQNLGCFFRTPMHMWTKVISIEEPESLAPIAERLGTDDTSAPSQHSSTAHVLVSQRASDLLDNITKHEYELFGSYLTRSSRVYSGYWALLETNKHKV